MKIKGDMQNQTNLELIKELKALIVQARQTVAHSVNANLTMLYWQIGERINKDMLNGERAKYGDKTIESVAKELTALYGNNFAVKSLRRMMQFASVFPDQKIVVSLIRQLSWTHFLALIPLKDNLQREFYAQMCRVENWSVRTLRKKIDSMLFERTALSKQPEKLVAAELATLKDKDQLSPELIFKDPYLLEFLGLNDHYLEKDLEDAILREMEGFLMEMGAGFAFLARQKRIQIDAVDFYLDLLFFNRNLNCLIAVELKQGDFKPEYKGQMELYLRWLDKHDRRENEDPPLGIILCTGKQQEQIELLQLDRSGIHVAEYLTQLPPKDMLRDRLHQAIEHSRQRLNPQALPNEQD